MNRLRLEWSIFIKSLRVLKKNRRLLNLLVPEAFLRLLLYGIAAKQIANLILLLFPDPEKPAFDTVEIVFPVVILLFTATAGVLVCRILSAFLLGIFYSEMIRGFGNDGILIKRGLLFAFIKRKALFRWGLNFFRQGKGNVFAVPTIICDEEAEEPDVIRNRVGTTNEHIWHTKGDFKGLLVLKLLLLLLIFAIPFLTAMAIGGIPPSGTTRPAILTLISAEIILIAVFALAVLAAEKVYIAALFCYAHGPDEVGEFTREELKNGF